MNARSEGRIKMTTFVNGELGSDQDIINQVVVGSVDIGLVDSSLLANLEPRLNVFGLPFLFSSRNKAPNVFNSKVGQELLAYLEPRGIKGLAWGVIGVHTLLNRVRPVSIPSDVKGMKVRTLASPLYVDLWTQLGTVPTPIAATEIYLALQLGTVDGADVGASYSVAQKFYEVAKYFTVTEHAIGVGGLIMNLAKYNQMPSDFQALMRRAAEDAGSHLTQVVAQLDGTALDTLRSHGVQVVDPVDTKVWASATSSVFDKYAASVGRDVVDAVVKLARS